MPETYRNYCFEIDGMDCPSCAVKIERAVRKIPGVNNITVDYLRQNMVVNGTNLTSKAVIDATGSVGHKATLINPLTPDQQPKSKLRALLPFISASILVAIGSLVELVGSYPIFARTIIVFGMFAGGWKLALKGLSSLRHLSLDMNFLMSISAIGAALLGEWIEAGVLVVLFALAEYLEQASLDRSRRENRALIELVPRTALAIKNGIPETVPIENLRIGDSILVKPGSMIPADATVIAGFSTVNQAGITGESLPVERKIGDVVLAGTINGDGALELRVDKTAGNSTLDRIIKLVEQAQTARTPVQTFIEKFARIYTPLVVLSAVLLAVTAPLFFNGNWHDWIYRALTLLVISCPCSLVLASPVALATALTAAARKGILIKGGRYLEQLSQTRAFAFDKTGTITEGNLTVNDVRSLDGISPAELVSLAASIEMHSEHPVGQAIVRYALLNNLPVDSPTSFTAYPGRGASAVIHGTTIFVGNHTFIEELGLCSDGLHNTLADVESTSPMAMLIASASKPLGVIGISDTIRSGVEQTFSHIRSAGVEHISLLTGDNQRSAEIVNQQIRADDLQSNLLPHQKTDAVNLLRARYKSVVMVGDGINDAPSLAAADVGIAAHGKGADVALETADIVLMGGRIDRLPGLIRLSRQTRRIIKSNITMAIGVKGLFLTLAALGMTSLWMALIADEGVALLVIFNGLRARHID